VFDRFKKKPLPPGVRVIRQAPPDVCGGTDATVDDNAPKTIDSEDMTAFCADSRLPFSMDEQPAGDPLEYLSAFAAPAADGVFLFLETARASDRRSGKAGWALVKQPLMPALARRVREWDLAKNNGCHSQTHGLPENFGGRVDIRYAGGETIRFSNNQTPILSRRVGEEMAAFFEEAMAGEWVALPSLDSLREIRFSEESRDGGFTRATMTLLPDGTAVNRKQMKFDDPQIYDSEKPMDADTVAAIKQTVETNGILGWAGLPHNGFRLSGEKRLTFVFDDGRQITVEGDRLLPDPIRGGFFSVELEMTTKG
jgi:hypothetical protein